MLKQVCFPICLSVARKYCNCVEMSPHIAMCGETRVFEEGGTAYCPCEGVSFCDLLFLSVYCDRVFVLHLTKPIFKAHRGCYF